MAIFDLKVSKTITIDASPEVVWDVVTNRNKIKLFLYGTNTSTDWKVGSPILFEGEYQGMTYKDKGNVIENVLNEKIKYNYWSMMSKTEDLPENYSLITYSIDKISEKQVKFTWLQEGFTSKQGCDHTDKTLMSMLEQIKKIAEV